MTEDWGLLFLCRLGWRTGGIKDRFSGLGRGRVRLGGDVIELTTSALPSRDRDSRNWED